MLWLYLYYLITKKGMRMKKLVLILIFTALLISCTTTEYLKYTGDNEIHPVIMKVFDENKIIPTKIDIIKKEYHSSYIYQTNFGAKIRYTILVKYLANNIDVQLKNIQQYNFKDEQWYNENRLYFFDETKLPAKITNSIYHILNKQSQYDLVKNEIYNNFQFHYLVIKNLSKVECNKWVKNHMLGRTYNLKVTLNKFRKNRTGKLPNMKYIAEFTNAEKSSYNDMFAINYYTNTQKFSTVDIKSQLTISGKLVESVDIADLLNNSSHLFMVEN